MEITFLPKTGLGKWSLGLVIMFLFLCVAGYLAGEVLDLSPDWEPIILMIARIGIILALVNLVLGVIAIVGKKERAVLVFLAVLMGLVVVYFIVGSNFFFTY